MRPRTVVEYIALFFAMVVFCALGAVAFIPHQMLFVRAFGFAGHEVETWASATVGVLSTLGYAAILIGLISLVATFPRWWRSKRWRS